MRAVGSRDLIRNWRRAVKNGTPLNVKHASLVAVAKALDVTVDWLIQEESWVQESPSHRGFSDTATPYEFSRPTATRDAPHPILSSLYGMDITPAAYMIGEDMPGFSIQAGDVVVVDMSRLPEPGEVAIVRIIDEASGESETILRRYLPPYLVGGGNSLKDDPMPMDKPGVTVRFPVVGSMRGLEPVRVED